MVCMGVSELRMMFYVGQFCLWMLIVIHRKIKQHVFELFLIRYVARPNRFIASTYSIKLAQFIILTTKKPVNEIFCGVVVFLPVYIFATYIFKHLCALKLSVIPVLQFRTQAAIIALIPSLFWSRWWLNCLRNNFSHTVE